jgi:hypothetical protein
MRPTRRVGTVGCVALLVAAVGCVALGWGSPVWYAAPALALVVVVTETAVVQLSFGRQRRRFSLTEAAVAAALVGSPRAWVVAAVVTGVLLVRLVRRQQLLTTLLAVTQVAAATAVGAGLATLVGGGVAGAVAGMASFWLVTTGLTVAVSSGEERTGWRSQVWGSDPLAAAHFAGTAGIGVLAAWLSVRAPLGLLALVVPLLLLWLSYDEQSTRAAEATLFADLARLQQQASTRSVDVSAQVILTAAARLLGGADVEMVLMSEEGSVHYVGDADGLSRRRVDPAVLDAPWVLSALGTTGAVTGTDDDGRPWCATALGGDASPAAVLVARRSSGSAGFGRRDVTLTEVLVAQAESWLSIASMAASRDVALAHAEAAEGAARALGDLGADTAPTLVVLRESADRLARLAAGGPASVQEIVGELYSVERAVASLLGAIALAAEPDLGRFSSYDGEHPVRQASHDWTTTGVL